MKMLVGVLRELDSADDSNEGDNILVCERDDDDKDVLYGSMTAKTKKIDEALWMKDFGSGK